MEVANQGKSVGILSAAPKTAGLQLGGSGNPDFLIAADTTNNRLESMAQIHGSTSTTGQGELTLSTQGTDSRGNVARGSINLIADSLKLNGVNVILNSVKIITGSMVKTVQNNNAVAMWSLSEFKSKYGFDYEIGKTIIIANNGDGDANDAHIEGVSYVSSSSTIYAVLDRINKYPIRINYAITHLMV